MRGLSTRHRAQRLVLLLLALCLPLLLLAGCAQTVRIGGQSVPLDAASLDIRGAGVTDVAPIKELTALTSLDLRDNEITAADYAALAAALPACDILWSVPIAGMRADSDQTSLQLPGFTEADIPLLAYFPQLAQVDAAGSADYAALTQAADAYPNCAFSWTVSIGGVTVPWDSETLDLKGQSLMTLDLQDAMAGLPRLTEVDLRETGFDRSQLTELIAAFPAVTFHADVRLFDTLYPADTATLDFSGKTDLDTDALIEGLSGFSVLTDVNLKGCALSSEQKTALISAYPGLRFHWEAELLPGLTVDSGAEEIVVTGYEKPDVNVLIQNLAYLPGLKKLDLTACYEASDATNAEMEKLMAAYPDTKFVWLVRVGNWELRTDITAFSMGNSKTFPGGRFMGGVKYPSGTDARIQPLKYCTDLVALDMGHAKRLTDVSCLAGLTKIRYLILGMTRIESIEALGNMPELEFLELYQCYVSDVSPLLNCKKLKYLNISTTFVPEPDDLMKMTQLKRLWIMKQQRMDKDDIAAIKEALPNTIIRSYMYAGGHSTTGGWRTKNPAYLYMQGELFHLPLQDQKPQEIGDVEYQDWDIEAFEAQ